MKYMSIEKGKISDLQLLFLIITFIQGSVLLTSFLDPVTKHDTWLVIISGFLISMPFVLVYIALAQMFPGKNLVEINDMIYGSYLGKLLSIIYFCFFLLLFASNLRIVSDFYNGFIMADTPVLLFLIVFTLVCAYGVRNGIETIARISFALWLVSFLILAITIILLMNDMKLSNFLPVFEIPLTAFLQGTHITLTIPFCEILVFLMVIPSLNNMKHVRKYTLMGLTLGAFLLLATSVRNTAVLGILTTIQSSSSYQVARLIDIGIVFTRVEVLISIGITLLLFMKISLLYYAAVLNISQIMRLRSYYPLILPIGIIAVCLALIMFNSTIDQGFEATYYYPIYATPFELIIPLLSLLIAKIRGFPKQTGGE